MCCQRCAASTPLNRCLPVASASSQLVTVGAFYITPFLRFDFSRALLLTLLPTFMMSVAFMVRVWRHAHRGLVGPFLPGGAWTACRGLAPSRPEARGVSPLGPLATGAGAGWAAESQREGHQQWERFDTGVKGSVEALHRGLGTRATAPRFGCVRLGAFRVV